MAPETAEAFELGTRLRTYRAANRITQQDLADRAGLSQVTISRLEAGEWMPKLETVGRLASALRIDVGDLLGVR